MGRWRGLCVVLVAVVTLGGCLGTPSGSPPPQTSEVAETTSDCPYYLSVERLDETSHRSVDRTLDYSNLSADRQAEFRTALERGDTELGTALPELWSSPVVVTYRGERYVAGAFVC